MLETLVPKKNKINLSDYDYHRDIESRLLMSQFSSLDLSVLEEILYSPLNISFKKLAGNLSVKEQKIRPIIEKLEKAGLLTIHDDQITVDKERRKYFEAQILKFEEDFCPGMEYLQNLLRKVPIHALPTWYAIPRSSNNILDSIIEKYLLTPQIYQRYLSEFHLGDQLLSAIAHEVVQATDAKVRAEAILKKFHLTHEQFEEALLHLEFNFICCLGYQKHGEFWEEIITPFHEWREYLMFLKETEAPSIIHTAEVEKRHPSDFSFIEDMTHFLELSQKQSIAISSKNALGQPLPLATCFAAITAQCSNLQIDSPNFLQDLHHLVSKLNLLKLIDTTDGRLTVLESAKTWLEMPLESRGMYMYRHPLNHILSVDLPPSLANERQVREAEKSILRVVSSGWVYYEDFVKGVHVPIGSTTMVMLKKVGKNWKYALPCYSSEELSLIRATIFEWLFEVGMISTGVHRGKECFCVTPFGQSLFGH